MVCLVVVWLLFVCLLFVLGGFCGFFVGLVVAHILVSFCFTHKDTYSVR